MIPAPTMEFTRLDDAPKMEDCLVGTLLLALFIGIGIGGDEDEVAISVSNGERRQLSLLEAEGADDCEPESRLRIAALPSCC